MSGEPVQLLSVTAALSYLEKPALVPWAAYKVADEVIRQVERSMRVRDMVLRELKAEAGVTESTMAMRDRADAEAWRALDLARDVWRDKRRARRTLAESRFLPDLDPETGQEYELSATGLGSVLHDVFDRWVLTGTRPDPPRAECTPYMDQFDRFLDVWQPKAILSEATGINLTRGYAGRLDTVWDIHYLDMGRVPCITDYKTSRKAFTEVNGRQEPTSPYPEAAVQLAAYETFEQVVRWDKSARMEKATRSAGRWYFIDDDELAVAQPMPPITGAYVIQVTPAACTPHPVVITDWARETWFYFLEGARRYYSANYKQLVGPPAAPPMRPDLRTPDLDARLEASLYRHSGGTLGTPPLRVVPTTTDQEEQ